MRKCYVVTAELPNGKKVVVGVFSSRKKVVKHDKLLKEVYGEYEVITDIII